MVSVAPILLILLITFASDAAVLLAQSALAGQLAGWLLVFALPGAALLSALPRDLRPRDGLEQIVLGFGLSLILSMLCFWLAALVSGLGIITRWLAVESSLIIVLALMGVWQSHSRAPQATTRLSFERSHLASMLIVLAVAAALRFISLGYGEYYDDELDVVRAARATLLGQADVMFEHRKGPTEIWLAAVAAGTSTQFDELSVRLPFAIASLGAIAATVLLGEMFFGQWCGLLAGLILSGEGIFLAFSRMVQYQAVVLLMIVLVVWCALRFWRAPHSRAELFYLAVGALCWAFGTLTHWDGALSGLVLAYAVVNKWRASLAIRKSQLILVLAISLLAVLIPALFYLQLFFNPQVAGLKSYAGERIGFGIFNGVPAFMQNATFYDASPFIVALLLLVGLSIARHLPRWQWLAFALMLAPFLWPDFLQLGSLNFSLLIFSAVLLLLLRSRTPTPHHPLLFIWLFTYFIVYAFVVKLAGLHFYTLMPALVLGASIQVDWYTGKQVHKLAPTPVYLSTCLLLLIPAYAYDAIAYLREQPEYALRYPQTAIAFFPTLYSERPKTFFFGFPYRYGWSVVGELYRRGVLRGKFESNETYLVTDWYARDLDVARDDPPRYYLRVDNSPRGGEVNPDLDDHYHRWGDVRVHGETKIQIYESNRYPRADVQVFNAEAFPRSDPQMLARAILYRQARGDDRAFRALGHFLERNTSEQDVIVLDTPLQDAILPYYYRGAARIVAASSDEAPSAAIRQAHTIYASLWAAGQAERTLAEAAFAIESRWFGSIRLAAYAPPADVGDVRVPGAYFGEHVHLQSASISPSVLRKGDVVRLTLRWQTDAPLTMRYKVFIHLYDDQGNILAQRDAEPMADLAPTTSWQAGETITDLHAVRIPANTTLQTLNLRLGLYDPATGERLPVRAANGETPLPDGYTLKGLTLQ